MRLVSFDPKTGEFVREVVHDQRLRRSLDSSAAVMPEH